MVHAANTKSFTLLFNISKDGELTPIAESELQVARKTADDRWEIVEFTQPVASRTYKIGDNQVEVTSVNWPGGGGVGLAQKVGSEEGVVRELVHTEHVPKGA